MRKNICRTLVFAGFIGLVATVTAQTPEGEKDYRIYLHNRVIHEGEFAGERLTSEEFSKLSGITIEEAEKIAKATHEREGVPSDEIFSGRYFRLIQFYSIPTDENRKDFESRGIELLDYIPNYAFLVSIPASISEGEVMFDRKSGSWLAYRSIPVLPEFKIRQNLKNLPLPEWAVKEPGTIDVNVSYYSNLNSAEVKQALIHQSFLIISANDYGKFLTIRLAVSQLDKLAALPFVNFIEPIAPDAKPENYTGRSLHRSNAIASDYLTGRHYDGTGVAVALGDDGPIGPHIDYQGRVDNSRVNNNDGNHGDHCGGTIMGAGNLDPKTKGMAFGATLEVFDVWDAVFESPTSIVTDSVVITSTSYSDGCNDGYTSSARTADQIIRQNPKLIHVFSAGNDGESDCGYGAGADWGNITGGIKVGKNVIQVGNINENGGLASSSSRGPAHDGRVMPLVCAKGTDVVSTIDVNDYASFTGTSMSCPGTAGTLAQLNQAYRELNAGQWPQSGLMKAILLNTADDLGNPGPDFKFGFGHINALRAVQCIEEQRYFSDSIAQGQSDQFTINVPAGTAEVRIMAYWHDREASNMASVALVNNLTLQVTDPNATIFDPWVLDHTPSPTLLNSNAVRGVDNLNNQEQVTIENPVAGTYSIDLSGTFVPQGPQEYFIVYEIIDSSITVTRPIGGESLKPAENEIIRWDAAGDYGTFSVEYSLDSGNTWQVLNSSVNGSQRHLAWSLPVAITGKALVKVSRNGLEDVSDSTFSILAVPGGLQVFRACPNSVTLKWNSLVAATSYDVYQLGSRYMDFIGNTTADTFVVTGTNQFSEYWFAVSANGANDANGRRCVAIVKNPGVWLCLEPDDVAVTSVISPSAGLVQDCSTPNAMNVKIELTNFSPNSMTNIPVSYKINNGTVVTETFSGSLAGFGTATHTFSSVETFVPGNYSVSAWASFPADANHFNDTVVSVSQFVSGSIITLPYTQDFETFSNCGTSSNCGAGICNLSGGWINPNGNGIDEIDWRTNSGSTPTLSSGPDSDHTPGTTAVKYVYLEASACFGRKAELLSPCIDLSGATSPTLSFWMHLYGASMGELHLDLFADGEWNNDIIPEMLSNWGNVWWQRTANLSAWAGDTVVLRWRGITGDDAFSDMALDDIQINPTPLGMEAEAKAVPFIVYPVPGDGLFTFRAVEAMESEITFRVIDPQGRVVRSPWTSFVSNDFTAEIDLRNLPVGVYFLDAVTGSGTWTTRLVIQ